MFVKQAKEGSKKNALVEAVSKYLNIKEPNIQIILNSEIDLSQKVNINTANPVKNEQETSQSVQKQEEEEYQAFMEAKKEEKENPVPVRPVDSSSQAAMVKELFDGKFID